MTDHEFEALLVDWARRRSDITALILAGSRASGDAGADSLSDWDFHLISNRPSLYQDTGWLRSIAPVWSAHAERTPRGVIKVSAIFEGCCEVDFVPLASWQMRLVYLAMRHPEWAGKMPTRLHRGIVETRAFLLGSGYRILIGGREWEERLSALQIPWPDCGLEEPAFQTHIGAFWQKSVWISKKIARPEPRSAMHWFHMLVTCHVYPMLAEEARLAGRSPRPEARKAEQWLDARRLVQTAIATSPDQRVLAKALLTEISLFEEVSRSVAECRGFVLPDHSQVAGWLRIELLKLSPPD
jgi:predicted nucleotidyltransferase